MAATSTKPKSPETMQFVGPAQQTHPSFMDLAMYYLTTFCSDWKNQTKPTCYIMPPLFYYKHPDKSDEDMEIQKKLVDQVKQEANSDNATQKELNRMERPMIDRQSDNGEFIVYQALWKLVQENIFAPLLVVQGLDLEKLRSYLQQIFPHVQSDLQVKFKEMMREYDFVLIGRRIGVIVIEVKSSRFTKRKDFAPSERKLPDHILEAVKQLNSFNTEFFHECARLQTLFAVPLRKILCTPNLEKSRFESWFNNLDQSDRDKVNNLLDGITHWFKEDLISNDPHSLKWSLHQMLEKGGFEIPFHDFEIYGAIIAGLSSALVPKKRQQLEMCVERFSTSAAVSKQAETIDHQGPLWKSDSLDQPSPAKKCKNDLDPKNDSEDKNLDKLDKNDSVLTLSSGKVIWLTPKQKSALNGPPVQFIVGSAGTGKTIILLAKALQMLRDNKSVLIYSTPCYRKQYEILTSGHKKCFVASWEGVELSPANPMNSSCGNFDFDAFEKKIFECGRLNEIVDYLSDLVKSNTLSIPEKVRELISSYDAVFIDDAIENGRYDQQKTRHLLCFLALITLAKTYSSSKIVWVALDHCVPGLGRYDMFLWQILNQLIKREQEEFMCASLDQVMRCSQSVFVAAYSPEILDKMTIKPIMGHKITGSSYVCDAGRFKTQLLMEKLWERTKQELEQFERSGYDYSQIAIIMRTDKISSRHRRWCGDHIWMFYKHHLDNPPDTCQNCHMSLDDTSLRNNFLRRLPARTINSDPLLSPGNLTIDTWDNVSSFEWPVVIVCCVIDQASKDSSSYPVAYKRYRACTRATTALVEIHAQRDTQAEEEEQLEVKKFHCRLRSALDEVTKFRQRVVATFNKLPEKWRDLFEAVWIETIPDSLAQGRRGHSSYYKSTIISPPLQFSLTNYFENAGSCSVVSIPSWEQDITSFLNGLQDEELRYYQMIIDKFCSVMDDYARKSDQ